MRFQHGVSWAGPAIRPGPGSVQYVRSARKTIYAERTVAYRPESRVPLQAVWVGGHPENVHVPGCHFHDEQHV